MLLHLPPRACLAWLATCVFLTSTHADDPKSVDFFENRIRPVLVNRCYECHSSDSEEVGGSLLLDSSDAMMTGGDSGPSIEPGDAEASVLISAIRYESMEMPPDGKLPDRVIDDFQRWIDAGAIDPRSGGASAKRPSQIDIEAGRKFWAFRPIQASPAPSTLMPQSRGMIDQFLGQRLQEAGIRPNEIASPEARLRRLAFDLTGLPPHPDVMRQWIADPSPKRWRKIVDNLLSSPALGEHWARHWMDVARYADSNGADFNAAHHEAWRYRDYLIRAFASDQPIDQMIRQQIAGDLLPAADDARRYDNVVASTFLMLGTKMLSERDKAKLTLDVVDEQIDTVGRAFLGLTLGCARCHDHKFDPVPTEDYYALAGIFRSTVTLNGESQKYVSTWNRVPLPTSDEHVAAVKKHQADVKSLEAKIKSAEAELKAAKSNHSNRLAGIVVDDAQAEKTGEWKASTLYKHFVGDGYIHDNNTQKGNASIRFSARLPKSGRYEVRLSHSPGSNRASAIPVSLETAGGIQSIVVDMRKVQIEPMWTSLGTFEFSSNADAAVTIRNDGTSGYVIADAVQFLSTEDSADGGDQPGAGNTDRINLATQQLQSLKEQLEQKKKSAPPPLPEAMAPGDRATHETGDSHVHVRGEVKNLGEVVPRGFLQVYSSGDPSIRRPTGSGRIQLADWLTDPDNPLVARVLVNRIWMHLMGEGLVRTVDNFGTQGQRPSHPELLDTLATEFVRDGWRSKRLIRRIVTSAAYQRSSRYNASAIAADPENRLLWRMHRRRIPAEAIRDSMLAAAGLLDRQPRIDPMKGRGTLVSSNSADSSAKFDDVSQPCRSVYLPVVRGYLPPLMTMLDAAEPDLLVGRRPTTNVPAQALVLVNGPEVNDWAKAAAERIMSETDDFDDRLRRTYLRCLHRLPEASDIDLAKSFFQENDQNSLSSWHEFIAALFASTEFRLLE